MQVRVEQRRQEVMRARDGVEIPGEVQVDVLHRHDLGVAAAGRPALHPEHRPERRLADTERCLPPDPPQRLRHAHRHRRLPLASGRGIDPGHEHQSALRPAARQRAEPYLRFVLAVQLDLVLGEPKLRRDVGHRAQLRRLGDDDIRRHLDRRGHRSLAGPSVASSRVPNARRALVVVPAETVSRDSPRARASAAATADTYAGSLRLPRWGTGARYGASVSTSSRSRGHAITRSASVQFLKVIMPLKEKYAAIAIPASNTCGPALNECRTIVARAPRSIAAISASASRACTTTGLPSSVPSPSCATSGSATRSLRRTAAAADQSPASWGWIPTAAESPGRVRASATAPSLSASVAPTT